MEKAFPLFALILLPFAAHGADFIESVHAQGAEIAKEMVVEGSQVVWSPFSVVNVLPLINGDESLKTGFKSAIEHFKDTGGIQISRLTTLFTRDKSKVEALGAEYGVTVSDFPETQLRDQVEKRYHEELGARSPAGLIPDDVSNVNQLFLTSLLVKAEWNTPFKYAPKSRFYLNETHAVKARYMTNIGFYAYGEIPGVDAKILSIPLRNSSNTSVIVVLPNNLSALSAVSAQFAQVQVGTILTKLSVKRTQLTLPKITVDSQLLLQPMPNVKIIQSGSIRFSYYGIDNRVSKIRRSSSKFVRTRSNRKDLKYNVNRPFIYMVFDTTAGVLNYGEVLLPQDTSEIHLQSLRTEEVPQQLTPNAQNLAAACHERGNQVFQQLKVNHESFAISPIVLSNLLASYATVASAETKELFFSTLNSKAGMIELYEAFEYVNATATNTTSISGGNEVLKERVAELGTLVTLGEAETSGYSEFNYDIKLRSSRQYVRSFYRNERDSSNATFYEYIGHVKYMGLPVYDARAVLLFPSASQSLLIFIPNERSGLHLVEDGLRDFTISKLLCQMRDRHARVRLPNFKISSSIDLLPALKDVLKVKDVEIEGLAGKKIQQLVHNVSITVTGGKDLLKLSRYSYNKYTAHRRKPSTRVNVDRPFVLYLLDKSGATLAVGRLTQVPEYQQERVATAAPPTPPVEIVEPPSNSSLVV